MEEEREGRETQKMLPQPHKKLKCTRKVQFHMTHRADECGHCSISEVRDR